MCLIVERFASTFLSQENPLDVHWKGAPNISRHRKSTETCGLVWTEPVTGLQPIEKKKENKYAHVLFQSIIS